MFSILTEQEYQLYGQYTRILTKQDFGENANKSNPWFSLILLAKASQISVEQNT